ncbi:MAG: class I SAM-dependent methyltransferase [Planctomycetota bacterium]|nr:MAG: class I SAM-dependent methyltransferase [Planctomycetota bacterium]
MHAALAVDSSDLSSSAATSTSSAAPLRLVHQPCCLCGIENAEPVAVGEDFEYRTSPDSFVAMRCRSCGLIYLNPRPAADSIDQIYPPNYHAFDFTAENFGLAHRIRSRLEARRLLSYCKRLDPAARILDIGCGDGFHLKLLKEFGQPGWRLEGVDASPRAVAAARRSGLSVHLGDVETAGLDPDSYDLVLLIATIEHVEDPLSVLRAAARLLRPGGRVVVATDNTATLDYRLFGNRHWGGYHFPRHWNLFDKPSLRRLAERAGLDVVELATLVSPVNWVYSIRNRLVDRRYPAWMVERFSLKAPVALAAFTVLDGLFQLFRRGALLKLIAEKPHA